MDTHQMEKWVLEMCEKEGWELNPNTDMNKAIEEIGEVSREIRRYHEGRQRPDEKDEVNKDAIVKELGSEVGDVLFTLIKIAGYYGLSLEECFNIHKEKMEKRYNTNSKK